jgi:excisionase family DNA binding protein
MNYSVKEAALQLGVSPSTLYNLIASKRIVHQRIGLKRGRIIITDDALEEFRRSITVRPVVGTDGAAHAAPPPAPRPKLRNLSL